jgi:translation initiation factor 6
MNFGGMSNIGIFISVTEDYAIASSLIKDDEMKEIEERLGVEVIKTSIGGSPLVGSLVCGNSNGFLVSRYILNSEIKLIENKINIKRFPDRMNACGNVILANDTAAVVHPEVSDRSIRLISRFLDVDVYKGSVGGYKTVGTAASVTNKGLLVNPYTKDKDFELLEKIFGLPIGVGTINFGSPLVGSGVIANSKGYLVGEETRGPEIARVEEVFQLI